MKNRCIIFLLSIIISVTAVLFCLLGCVADCGNDTSQYLRIHIRADSNERQAQAVKYEVRDAVVAYLTPIVAHCQTKEQAVLRIQEQLSMLQAVAVGVLEKAGFSYRASANIKQEVFPTRVYGEYTLPSGRYTALIVSLGAGRGDNWWCVVYPPLCFVAPQGQNAVYKSKIIEIIEQWKK